MIVPTRALIVVCYPRGGRWGGVSLGPRRRLVQARQRQLGGGKLLAQVRDLVSQALDLEALRAYERILLGLNDGRVVEVFVASQRHEWARVTVYDRRRPMTAVPDLLRAADPSGQVDDVLALPDHLRDALWRVESAGIAPFTSTGLVVAGMGGSAIGADLATVAFGARLTAPLVVARGYELPAWLRPDRAVLCSSYSGDTEETLACYEAAEALGTRRVAATTGGRLAELARRDGVPVIGLPAGLQPRAAVGYTFVCAAEVAALAGVADAIRTEIDSSAAHLEGMREGILERAGEIGRQLEGALPIVYGADLTAPVGYRWKCQMNENAKLPAFSHGLPEADHNEIVGWGGSDAWPLAAIFLADRDQHPRVRQRLELTAEIVAPHAAAVIQLETEGESRTERLLWAVMLGDLVSLQVAALRGVDPRPIDAIERLKDRLGRP